MNDYENKFKSYINDDLDTPKALALVWEIVKNENITNVTKRELLLDFDKVLGLQLDKKEIIEVPEEVKKLVVKRDQARTLKDFATSDKLREQIESLGFEVKDSPEGTKIDKS